MSWETRIEPSGSFLLASPAFLAALYEEEKGQ